MRFRPDSLFAGRWRVALAAAALLALTMGARSSLGLFLGPINTATGIGWGGVSLALAASHLAWGAAQPLCGWLAARFGVGRVVAGGALAAALLSALVPLAGSAPQLAAVIGLAGAASAAAGSAPLLLGVVTQRVPAAMRGLATGIVSAGGSAGQLLLAPAAALAIAVLGWAGALVALGLLGLLALPLVRALLAAPSAEAEPTSRTEGEREGARRGVGRALRDADYWLVTAGFCVCGFHVSFMTAHMPGVIAQCGAPASLAGLWLAIVGACNIAGSLAAGALMQRVPMRALLGGLYAARAAGVGLFLLTPKTPSVLLLFALWMGITYMATLPPTSGLIARLHGAHNLPVLLGITMAVHQVGSFLGAWLGGVAVEQSGSYDAVWMLDLALALAAVLLHVPVRERPAPAPPRMPVLAVR